MEIKCEVLGDTRRVNIHRSTFRGGGAHRAYEKALTSGNATSERSLCFSKEHMCFFVQTSSIKIFKVRLVSEERRLKTDALYAYAPTKRSVDSRYLHAKTCLPRSAGQRQGHAFSLSSFLANRYAAVSSSSMDAQNTKRDMPRVRGTFWGTWYVADMF